MDVCMSDLHVKDSGKSLTHLHNDKGMRVGV